MRFILPFAVALLCGGCIVTRPNDLPAVSIIPFADRGPDAEVTAACKQVWTEATGYPATGWTFDGRRMVGATSGACTASARHIVVFAHEGLHGAKLRAAVAWELWSLGVIVTDARNPLSVVTFPARYAVCDLPWPGRARAAVAAANMQE